MVVGYWIVAGLLALLYLYAGAKKIVQSQEQLAPMMGWVDTVPMPVVRFIGAVEIVGAAGADSAARDRHRAGPRDRGRRRLRDLAGARGRSAPVASRGQGIELEWGADRLGRGGGVAGHGIVIR